MGRSLPKRRTCDPPGAGRRDEQEGEQLPLLIDIGCLGPHDLQPSDRGHLGAYFCRGVPIVPTLQDSSGKVWLDKIHGDS